MTPTDVSTVQDASHSTTIAPGPRPGQGPETPAPGEWPAAPWTGTLLAAALLFGLTLACNLPLLGSTPLAGTEGHRAITAHQMVTSGDWVLPKLYDRLYLAKPSLHYWLIALCEKLAGRGDEFVWRLPSVLAGAALNAALVLFGTRWFGRVGGLASGFAGLGLVALWGQIPSADVDSTDTLFAALTALCLIELYYGRPARRWVAAWVLGTGLSLAATLLIKGPAGLPPVLGVILWPPVVSLAIAISGGLRGAGAMPLLRRTYGTGDDPEGRRQWRRMLSPATWAPLLVAAAVCGGYALLGLWSLKHSHMTLDWSGVSEGTDRLVPKDWARMRGALLLAPLLFLFTLPVSLALPLLPAVLGEQPGGPRPSDRLAMALAGGLLLSWAVCVVSGTDNPRWAYTTLPLLAPLAGAVVARAGELPEAQAHVMRGIAVGCAIVMAAAQAFFTVAAWRVAGLLPAATAVRPTLAACLAVALASAGLTAWGLLRWRRGSLAPWGLALMVVLLTVPFTLFNRADRVRRSGKAAAAALRDVVGPGAVVGADRVLLSEPEVFFYAGVDVHRLTRAAPSATGFRGWVLAYPDELKRWSASGTFTRVTPFHSYKMDAELAWYTPE